MVPPQCNLFLSYSKIDTMQVAATQLILDGLTDEERDKVMYDIDSEEWYHPTPAYPSERISLLNKVHTGGNGATRNSSSTTSASA